jgi:hypothetical protein
MKEMISGEEEQLSSSNSIIIESSECTSTDLSGDKSQQNKRSRESEGDGQIVQEEEDLSRKRSRVEVPSSSELEEADEGEDDDEDEHNRSQLSELGDEGSNNESENSNDNDQSDSLSQNGLSLSLHPNNNNNFSSMERDDDEETTIKEEELYRERLDEEEEEDSQGMLLVDESKPSISPTQALGRLKDYHVNGDVNVHTRRSSSSSSSGLQQGSTTSGGGTTSSVSRELCILPHTSKGNNNSSSDNFVKIEGDSNNDAEEDEAGETVLQKFEKDISDLNNLLSLKEREWNSILKLVKLKEIMLAQLRRRKEVEGMLEIRIPTGSAEDYLDKLLSQIAGESNCGSRETGFSAVHVQNSINMTEKQVADVVRRMSNSRIHQSVGGTISSSTEVDTEMGTSIEGSDNFFLASNALKNLVNKNKTTLTSYSIPAVPKTTTVSSSTSVVNLKVIGEGRQGPIVEVASLIADYRLENKNSLLYSGNW